MKQAMAVFAITGLMILGVNAPATVEEDSNDWSCVDMGNHACGPGNANGVPAGCYDIGGVWYATYPCDGWWDV